MALDSTLLAILACPQDRGPLYYLPTEDVLYNPRLGRTYPVREDIPVLLVDEASTLEADEQARIDRLVDELGIEPTFEA